MHQMPYGRICIHCIILYPVYFVKMVGGMESGTLSTAHSGIKLHQIASFEVMKAVAGKMKIHRIIIIHNGVNKNVYTN